MRIAIAADGSQGLDGMVSFHFGRCSHYTLVDVNEGKIQRVRVIANPFYGSHGEEGEVPNFIRNQGVGVMITGGMGPRAIGYFNEFGIEVITGANGGIRDALNNYLSGRLSGAQPCIEGETHPDQANMASDNFSIMKEEAASLQKRLAELGKRISELEQGPR